MRSSVVAACLAVVACTEKPASEDNWAELCAIRSCESLEPGYSYAEIDGALYKLPGVGTGWPGGGRTFVRADTNGRQVGYFYLTASSLTIDRPLYAAITRRANVEKDTYGIVRIDMQSPANGHAFNEIDRVAERIAKSPTVKWSDDFLKLAESSSVFDQGTDTRKLELVSERPLAFGRRAYLDCDTFCDIQLLRSEDSGDDWPVMEVLGFRVTALPNCEAEPPGCLSQRELISQVPARMAILESNLRAIRSP